MFDYATSRSRRSLGASPAASTALSAVAHVAVLIAIAASALSASDALPDPPKMMAFVVAPAPPLPPPPPAPSVEAPKRQPIKQARTRRIARQNPTPVAVPAPLDAPAGISPEKGLEGPPIEAGFEAGVPGGIVGGVAGGIIAGSESLVPPPPAPAPVRVGGDVVAPRLTRRVEPRYPVMAEHAQIQGVVLLEALVNPEGFVDSVKVLRAHPLLGRAAVDAVEQWQYEPLLLNGQATPFILTVTVRFSIG